MTIHIYADIQGQRIHDYARPDNLSLKLEEFQRMGANTVQQEEIEDGSRCEDPEFLKAQYYAIQAGMDASPL